MSGNIAYTRGQATAYLATSAVWLIVVSVVLAGIVVMSGCGSSGPSQHERDVAAVLRDLRIEKRARREADEAQAWGQRAGREGQRCAAEGRAGCIKDRAIAVEMSTTLIESATRRIKRAQRDAEGYSQPAIKAAYEAFYGQ